MGDLIDLLMYTCDTCVDKSNTIPGNITINKIADTIELITLTEGSIEVEIDLLTNFVPHESFF